MVNRCRKQNTSPAPAPAAAAPTRLALVVENCTRCGQPHPCLCVSTSPTH